MKLLPIALAVLLLVPLVALAPSASAWPPVCIVREVGGEGGKAHVVVWANCGVGASVTTCPKDAFCHTVSTDPEGQPEAVFLPPVCIQKSASARGTTVTAQVTCEVWVEVTHCPPFGSGPCWALLVGPVLG